MFDEIFEGSAKDKFFEILFNANRDICDNEIDNLVKRCITLEMLLESKCGDMEKEVRSMQITEKESIEKEAVNKYIEMMASILSQNE